MNTKQFLEFAIYAHGEQKYGDKPYEFHLREVINMMKIMVEGNPQGFAHLDLDKLFSVCAGHDLFEDTFVDDVLLVDLRIGCDVINGITNMTKVKGETYANYIKKVRSSQYSLWPKIADTTCNLYNSIIGGDKARIIKYSKQLILLNE
jgi:hypothetical protein